jgi:glyoxylase-like metal-dependent hydrolase (beta-lactamase superfamily II)
MNLPIADIWYGVEPVEDGIVRLREAHVDPYLSGEIWLVRGRDGDLAIDTGAGILPPAPVIEAITGRSATGVALCYFFDHAGGLYSFAERACHAIDAQALADGRDAVEAYVCPEMVSALPWAGYDVMTYRLVTRPTTRVVEEGDVFDLGDRSFEVLHVPGRSRGSIALWEPATGNLFTGDTLLDDPQDRDFPPEDPSAFGASLERLARLPVTRVFAGHYGSFDKARMLDLIRSETKRYCEE